MVLFDNTDLSKWEADTAEGGPTKWIVKDGAMECVPRSGYIRTKEKFGDCQLHIEWAAPAQVRGDSQGRGNSGVFLMGLVEVQVLDNYNNPTYSDGMAGAVYGGNLPMANALLPPGEFQVYDIVFRRPIYKDGQQIDPGYVTVFENGVLVQDHTPLEGGTGHMTRSKPGPFPDVGPLKLQDHGNPVRYRNIWYRPLPPCPIEGGTDGGYLTVEAATAMRKEIAAHIRQDAATLKDPANPLPELLRLAEALEYEKDEATLRQVEAMATQYVANLKQLATDQITSRMADAKQLQSVLAFLARFRTISPAFGPKLEIDQIVKDKNWDKK